MGRTPGTSYMPSMQNRGQAQGQGIRGMVTEQRPAPIAPRGNQGSWRSFGDPGSGRPPMTPQTNAAQVRPEPAPRAAGGGSDSGWRRFGDPGPARGQTPNRGFGNTSPVAPRGFSETPRSYQPAPAPAPRYEAPRNYEAPRANPN